MVIDHEILAISWLTPPVLIVPVLKITVDS